LDIPTLIQVLKKCKNKQIFILGGGTNILFSDRGFRGIVIKLSGDFKKIGILNETVCAGAAASLSLLLNECAKSNLDGLQCCAGIPGSVGGAVYGNAGTNLGTISQHIKYIEAIDFSNAKLKILNKNEIEFSYRKSSINEIITRVFFSLKAANKNDILAQIQNLIDKRKSTQPIGIANAGCIFKNPPKMSSGKIIEDLGLKGLQIGGAEISYVHANFIVNKQNAKAADVLRLIEIIKQKAKEKFNIDLQEEIKIIGVGNEY
jgi:UDP-N-acetylmuramate dehydrogenase